MRNDRHSYIIYSAYHNMLIVLLAKRYAGACGAFLQRALSCAGRTRCPAYDRSQRSFSSLFFQIFTLRVKIWKNESFKYLAAAGESG
jgi:hypothetical protein